MNDFGHLLALEIPVLRRYSCKLTRDPVEAEDLCRKQALLIQIKAARTRRG